MMAQKCMKVKGEIDRLSKNNSLEVKKLLQNYISKH